MKKKILLFILLLFPIVVMAENVSIKSVKLVEKDTYVEEVGKPKFDGLKVDFDLKFENLGDKAAYLLEIENKDSENYFIDLKVSSTSKYILYTLDSDESTNVVKANSSTKVYVIIKYNEEVPSYKLTNNKYTEKESIKVSLTNNKGEEVITESTAKNSVIVVNPNTGNIVLRIKNTNVVVSLYTVIAILLIAIVAIIVLKKLKVKKYTSMILVLGMILIPGMVSAIKTINVEINSNIEIEPVKLIEFTLYELEVKENDIDSSDSENHNIMPRFFINTTKQKAKEGMTFKEWLESKYNVDKLEFMDFNGVREMMESMSDEELNQCIESAFIVDGETIKIAFGDDIPLKGELIMKDVPKEEPNYNIFLDDEIEDKKEYAIIKQKKCLHKNQNSNRNNSANDSDSNSGDNSANDSDSNSGDNSGNGHIK